MTDASTLIHATAVSISGYGVMIGGKSGSGKSDLALRLIDRGAMLICDDYVALFETSGASDMPGALMLSTVPNIAGKIEIRGLGILSIPYVDFVPLRLYVDLDMEPIRHPDHPQKAQLAGHDVPMIAVRANAHSACIVVEMALQNIIADQVIPQKVKRL